MLLRWFKRTQNNSDFFTINAVLSLVGTPKLAPSLGVYPQVWGFPLMIVLQY